MSKVSIEQLENIVLEGGGAKGAAYAGAIRGIEGALLEKLGADASNCTGEGIAILDYGKTIGDEFVPQVKLFAGSSAGAITSMALALGFSAEEIELISEFEFSKFLKDKHPGKYRMIAKDCTLQIGEDHKSLLGTGDGIKPYEFQLKTAQTISPSWFKDQLRGAFLGLIKDILIRGFVEKLPNVRAIWQKLFQGGGNKSGFDLEDYLSAYGAGALLVKWIMNLALGGSAKMPNSPMQIVASPAGTPVAPAVKEGIITGIKELIDLWIVKLSKDSGMNLSFDAIGNVIWDRGLFSGFAVREFFFDMMLFACVKNTHFHRSYFTKEEDRKALRDVDMSMKDGRLKANFTSLPDDIKDKLLLLPNMTFKQFYDVSGITLVICVSNFSTDEPCYFSPYWTPDFPVLEAVGASMSIPPAIRPVYNEGDVYKDKLAVGELYAMSGETMRAKKSGKLEYFHFDDYYLDAVAIKAFLAKHFGTNIDPNTTMGVAGHLTYLRQLLVELEDAPGYVAFETVEGNQRRLTRSHFIFHYNAAFKGLFLDGGYLNNIPYNILRTEMYGPDCEPMMIDPSLDKTLAVKLDETFPREWVGKVYAVLEAAHQKLGSPKYLAKEQRKVLGKILRANFRVLLTNSDAAAHKLLENMDDIKSMNDASFERVVAVVVALRAELTEKHRQPWNKKKSILMTAFEGYAYGAANGQVRYLSDHDHILPLYSYGVDTFDFDLQKIAPLVKLSKDKSEKRVLEYFGITPK